MIKFDTRLKPETIESIKSEAEKDGRTACGMARKILEDYFKQRHRPIINKDLKCQPKDMTEFFKERNKNK